ncbi:MAG: endopeptidase La [Gemmatimonadetes bacterium]|nr:endopeptidase La [Gemmatimonadota bacterium]
MVLPLLVGRPRSAAALAEAAAANPGAGLLLLVAQRDPGSEDPAAEDLHRVGTVARVIQTTPLADGTARVVFEGVARVQVRQFLPGPGPFRAEISPLPYPTLEDPATGDSELQALVRRVERGFREYVDLHPDLPSDLAVLVTDIEDPVKAGHRVAGHLLVSAREKQRLLEAESLPELFHEIMALLERELEILRIEDRLDLEMRRRMDDDRRQHYLTEQLRAIQKELGSGSPEFEDVRARLAAASLPDVVREKAELEFERLQRMNPVSPEAAVIRSYLDWILALPWQERTADNPDVAHARTVLAEAHFGLEEVKDRILDHIAVLSLVGELKGPILCVVGPPGVGKTSLGKTIAKALNRNFVRVALGGVRDEAEIRGHRRTYVGSLPGRILQGIRRAQSRNPVFLLDEVDKLTKDGHGDPSAALLEVLDPEQNRTFQDHYLELEFDLSEVLFVATANTLGGIPDPLRDRMEVIRIPGYLDTEKRSIARDFLIPEQLRRHGLDQSRVRISDEVVARIVESYTREAGVRELDRLLARVARKMARRVAEGALPPTEQVLLQVGDLNELLGPVRHLRTSRDAAADRVGIATGLAWTAAGGELLEVEVSVVAGTGAVQLTGTLGDVMKESAMAAVTYARARARELGLKAHFHSEVDVHIHIPEGATPKEGPSAGVTIAAALVSALTGIPTRDDVALTGEITIRGRVLPVGGIKEKAVAALRSGIGTMILPQGNAPELELLPAEVRERVRFLLVDRMDAVLDLVLTSRPGASTVGTVMGEALGDSSNPGTRLSQ